MKLKEKETKMEIYIYGNINMEGTNRFYRNARSDQIRRSKNWKLKGLIFSYISLTGAWKSPPAKYCTCQIDLTHLGKGYFGHFALLTFPNPNPPSTASYSALTILPFPSHLANQPNLRFYCATSIDFELATSTVVPTHTDMPHSLLLWVYI